jgi:hypothetical protein
VTIGGTAYLLGGDNGEAADGDVLATADGRSFRTVATLAIPVRYPAAAVLGGKLYVFGGETKAPGAAEWAATGAVQQVDLRTGKSAVVGYLPVALVAASAVTLDGYVYLAGGQVSGRASATIWGLQPRMAPGKPLVLVSGHLDEPVSNAGTAVAGSTAWLVGGEVGGRPIASVQMFRPAAPTSPTAARPAHPGKG